jgi:hypothetical protein
MVKSGSPDAHQRAVGEVDLRQIALHAGADLDPRDRLEATDELVDVLNVLHHGLCHHDGRRSWRPGLRESRSDKLRGDGPGEHKAKEKRENERIQTSGAKAASRIGATAMCEMSPGAR